MAWRENKGTENTVNGSERDGRRTLKARSEKQVMMKGKEMTGKGESSVRLSSQMDTTRKQKKQPLRKDVPHV